MGDFGPGNKTIYAILLLRIRKQKNALTPSSKPKILGKACPIEFQDVPVTILDLRAFGLDQLYFLLGLPTKGRRLWTSLQSTDEASPGDSRPSAVLRYGEPFKGMYRDDKGNGTR